MSETKPLFDALKELADTLRRAHDSSQEASEEATKYGGEWEQETSTDLDEVTVRIRTLMEDVESITREARTLRDDADEEETVTRQEKEDEEAEKESIEETQDKINERDWRRHQI
jgi:uncharacterized protein YoxC